MGIIFDWGRTLYDRDQDELFPDAKAVLVYLSRRYKLAIVSLAPDGDIEARLAVLRCHAIESLFTAIRFTPNDKDGSYRATLRDLDLRADEVAVVDDRVCRRIRWGNDNGARTIWFQNGKFSTELPDDLTGSPMHVIHTLSELMSLY